MPSFERTTTRVPLFVGGVPRSGTHAIANLIARHSRYAMVPRELGFHTGVGQVGLPDLLEEQISLTEFLDVMRGHWWSRTAPWDETIIRGLHKTVPEDRFRWILKLFAQEHKADPFVAARMLMTRMLDPIADEAGKHAWVEMDPYNMVAAPILYRIFPDMKIIHIMRDGRDVASSLRDLPWGRTGLLSNIWRWQRILHQGHEKVGELPTSRVLVVQLEDLVANRREYTYERILDFLELQDEPSMHTFFDEHISAERAHVGRWRASLSPMRQRTVTAAYACALARLSAAGVSPRPGLRTLESVPDVADFARRPQKEVIDPWADGKARDA